MLRKIILTIAVLAVSAPTLSAQIQYYNKDKWELSLLFGLSAVGDKTSVTPVDGQEETRLVTLDFSSGYMAGGRITENLTDNLGAELEYSFANQPMAFLDVRPTLPRLDLKHHVHSAVYSLVFYPTISNPRLRPYVSAGMGAAFFQIEGASRAEAARQGVDLQNVWKLAGAVGGGVKYLIGDLWGVRFDIRDQITGVPGFGLPKSSPSFQGNVSPGFNPDGLLHNWQLSTGVMFYWGGF
jgi:outer membrane protein W